MSRHRYVKQLDINAELEDDALSDGADDDYGLTPEQEALMNDGFDEIRQIFGSEQQSGLSDLVIKNALYELWFDVDKTTQWLKEEQDRQVIANERKDVHSGKDLPPTPFDTSSEEDWFQHEGEFDMTPTFMQQPDPLDSEAAFSYRARSLLTTITERTEQTEASRHWPPRQQLMTMNDPRPLSSGSSFTSYGQVIPAREREKAQNQAQKWLVQGGASSQSAVSSRNVSGAIPSASIPSAKSGKKTTAATQSRTSGPVAAFDSRDQKEIDMSALNLIDRDVEEDGMPEELPKITVAREKILEEVRNSLKTQESDGKWPVSLIVIGHVDAGKSTLMGRLLYELGKVDEKTRHANERGSSKIGKSSFSWAWQLDGTTEERERGITMDVALEYFTTAHRQITVLDAPGHKDFIPNMISGAAQADCALLVVDATPGEFEAGFERGGQTREHVLLVRSLGVSQIIVTVNKFDQVQWAENRYNDIVAQLRPFLVQTGFHPSKTSFVPVAAMSGVNLVSKDDVIAGELQKWYKGPTLVDLLDQLEPPSRNITLPFRLPISNVFRGSGSGIAVTGRVCAGVVQAGERLRILPGDETAAVKSIEVDDMRVPWAAAGSNATLYLVGVDAIHLTIGSVLCPPDNVITLATSFSARIIVFDVQVPITAGTSVELFHHSRDSPATISKLVLTLDRATGTVIKKNPRILTKGVSAEVQITLRSGNLSSASPVRPIPLEPFSVNKEMGRILIRRAGESVGAGIVLDILV